MDFNDLIVTPVENACKGLVFRYKKSVYFDKRGLHTKEDLIPLKRLSCSCGKCDATMFSLQEDVACGYPPDLSELTSGKAYSVRCHVTSKDFETGYADEWEWRFVEYKEG